MPVNVVRIVIAKDRMGASLEIREKPAMLENLVKKDSQPRKIPRKKKYSMLILEIPG